MAISKPAISVLWSTAATGSVSAGGSLTSDAFSIAVDEVSGEFVLVATSGSTDSGYNINFFLLGSADGSNYSSAGSETGIHLGSLYMAATSTAYRSRPINVPLGLQSYKIFVESENAGTDSTTVDVEGKALNLE